MSPPSPSPTVPPELLDRDSLPALLDRLRANRSPELAIDLSGTPRLATPVLQVLLAAARGGVALRLLGAGPALVEGIALLGLDGHLSLEAP